MTGQTEANGMPLGWSEWKLFLTSGAFASVIGCSTSMTCDDTASCPAIDGGAGGGQGASGASGDAAGSSMMGGAGPGGASGAGGASVDGGGDADTGPPCDGTKKPSESSCVIDDRFGVFVSPMGSDANAGTKASPFKTIGTALARAKSAQKRVYACAGTYAEAVMIDASTDGAKVFGGLDCSTWSYSASNRPLVKPTAGIPIAIKNLATGATIEDMEFDAPLTSMKGESSLAALVASSSGVKLTRVKLVAQNAQDGADAPAATPNYDSSLLPDNAKIAGQIAMSANGGVQQDCATLCTNDIHATGGKGGNGAPGADAGAPTNGDDGKPTIAPPDPPSATGKGGTAATSIDQCTNGRNGSNAPAASGGAGASKAGMLGAMGWTPMDGAAGTTAGPGQGGGGGGGGISTTRGGGGGGGCGGCGGSGASGGKGGGSSFALLSFQSTVMLDGAELVAGNAGAGGKGADGQVGQVGGNGGVGPPPGCNGGSGGQGGPGGGGGGGAGGLSVAIAYVGTMPMQTGAATMTTIAQPGSGGAAGLGGMPAATKGKDGAAQAVIDVGG